MDILQTHPLTLKEESGVNTSQNIGNRLWFVSYLNAYVLGLKLMIIHTENPVLERISSIRNIV
jgi:hypothetical protein